PEHVPTVQILGGGHMKVLFRLLSVLLLVPAMCLLLSGCGKSGGGGAVGVEGKVTYKGQPVTGGKLKLHHPKEGSYPININADAKTSPLKWTISGGKNQKDFELVD